MRIAIEINQGQLKAATAALSGIKGGIEKAIAGAVGETLKTVKVDVSKTIRSRMNIKKKVLDDEKNGFIKTKQSKLSGAVIVRETARPTIGGKKQNFNARQTASGVSYRVRPGKTSKIAGAFGPKIAKLNFLVFKRAGARRTPLVGPMKGPSPWGVFVKNELGPETQEKANKRLARELDERVVFLVKKANGLI